jgi:hypothetical protein
VKDAKERLEGLKVPDCTPHLIKNKLPAKSANRYHFAGINSQLMVRVVCYENVLYSAIFGQKWAYDTRVELE